MIRTVTINPKSKELLCIKNKTILVSQVLFIGLRYIRKPFLPIGILFSLFLNMKKVALLSIVLLMAGIAHAQVTGGIKAGLNYSNIIKTGDDDFSTDFKAGFHAGLFVDIPLVDRLAFMPEVMYSQKGYKADGTSLLGGAYEYSLTSNFIDVPLLLKVNAAPGFSIHLGPQFSFLMSTTENFKQGSDAYRTTVREENDNLKKNIFAGVAGIEISGESVGISARYGLDFKKNNENGSSETPAYKNQVFQLGLSIKL